MQIFRISQNVSFCGQQLDGKISWFFYFYPPKYMQISLKKWQYCKAEMATKQEMYVKYRCAICFQINLSTNTGY